MKKIKYIISTHIDYYQSTLEKLIDSLIVSGIIKEDIFIAMGGTETAVDTGCDGIETVFTQNNSFDLTALIEVVKGDLFEDYDYVFLLHDTCEVGMYFQSKVESFIYDDTVTVRLFRDFSSCSIGLYKRDYLSTLKSTITDYENQSKTFYVRVEDCFFNNHNFSKQAFSANTQILAIRPVYSDDVLREVNLCEEIELYKYKANWTIKEWTVKP